MLQSEARCIDVFRLEPKFTTRACTFGYGLRDRRRLGWHLRTKCRWRRRPSILSHRRTTAISAVSFPRQKSVSITASHSIVVNFRTRHPVFNQEVRKDHHASSTHRGFHGATPRGAAFEGKGRSSTSSTSVRLPRKGRGRARWNVCPT